VKDVGMAYSGNRLQSRPSEKQ